MCCPAGRSPSQSGSSRRCTRARARGSASRARCRCPSEMRAWRDFVDASAAEDGCRKERVRTSGGCLHSRAQCIVAGMRVFMTGAPGYIGGAVASELRHHGHEVAALVRPDSEARHLRDLGIVIMAGDLDSLPSLGDTLNGYDAYIHTAFAPQLDRSAIDTLAPRGGHFIYTSGVWSFSNTTTADENTSPDPLPISAWRVEHEQIVLQSASRTVIRPGCVYGGKQSLLAGWFAAVDQNQPIEIAGDGSNHWAMIELHDLAQCYVAVAEQRAPGIVHATDDTHETLATCARALAANVAVHTSSAEEARAKFGDTFAEALLVDQIVSSNITRERLGWTPKRTFINSIDEQWREWRESQSTAR